MHCQTAFLLWYGDRKNDLANSLYRFLFYRSAVFAGPYWPLIVKKACILEPLQFNDLTPLYCSLTPISDQSTTRKKCGLVKQNWYRMFNRPFSRTHTKEKGSDNARLPYTRKLSKGLILENFESSRAFFENIFSKSIVLSCTCTSGMFLGGNRIMVLLRYFKRIEPLKNKEFKVFYLHQIVHWHVIPSSAIKDANS